MALLEQAKSTGNKVILLAMPLRRITIRPLPTDNRKADTSQATPSRPLPFP